jgi:hypothetical protein
MQTEPGEVVKETEDDVVELRDVDGRTVVEGEFDVEILAVVEEADDETLEIMGDKLEVELDTLDDELVTPLPRTQIARRAVKLRLVKRLQVVPTQGFHVLIWASVIS